MFRQELLRQAANLRCDEMSALQSFIDSPDNLSSSCSITERLSEKYCVTRFCRSGGEPAFCSEEAKTSVMVFFF